MGFFSFLRRNTNVDKKLDKKIQQSLVKQTNAIRSFEKDIRVAYLDFNKDAQDEKKEFDGVVEAEKLVKDIIITSASFEKDIINLAPYIKQQTLADSGMFARTRDNAKRRVIKLKEFVSFHEKNEAIGAINTLSKKIKLLENKVADIDRLAKLSKAYSKNAKTITKKAEKVLGRYEKNAIKVLKLEQSEIRADSTS
jgi:hypothetical protein